MFKELPQAVLERFLSAIDPWHGVTGYLAEYRQVLDRAAAEIGPGMRMRYNSARECAELVRGRVVFARIKVQGGEGVATSIVEPYKLLQSRTRDLLMEALPNARFGCIPAD